MSTLYDKLEDWLWRADIARAPWHVRAYTVTLRYVVALGRDLFGGLLSLHAMSLVYSTLLATVPLIAFSFSVLKGLNLHKQFQPLLLDFLAPLGEQGVTITNEIMAMVDKVSGGVLGGLSLTIFLYTAISMVQKVERSFNYVWHVSQPRSIGRRVLDYATVLLVGPLVMALAIASTASLSDYKVVQMLTENQLLSPVMAQAGRIIPFVLVTLLFTALYKWMPNTRINFSAALVGGITAGCLWALIGMYFATFVINSARALIIYAGFAIAITTLIWIYINWLVLLLGARLAFYFQNRAYLRIGRDEPTLSNATREQLALDIMWMTGTAFRDQQREVTTRDIAKALGIPGIAVGKIVAQLEAAKLIAATETEELIPALDINAMRIRDIVAAVRTRGDSGIVSAPQWSAAVRRLGESIQDNIDDAVGELTLGEFIDRAASADPA